MRSISTYSRMIRAKAEPKMMTVPAMLPKIIPPLRQKGNATSRATMGVTVSSRTIQNHWRLAIRRIVPRNNTDRHGIVPSRALLLPAAVLGRWRDQFCEPIHVELCLYGLGVMRRVSEPEGLR